MIGRTGSYESGTGILGVENKSFGISGKMAENSRKVGYNSCAIAAHQQHPTSFVSVKRLCHLILYSRSCSPSTAQLCLVILQSSEIIFPFSGSCMVCFDCYCAFQINGSVLRSAVKQFTCIATYCILQLLKLELQVSPLPRVSM